MTPIVSGQNASQYCYPISSFTAFQLPTYLVSARMYVSMGSTMAIPFNGTSPNVGVAYPNIENPSDPCYKDYFDWVEFAVENNGIWVNTTQVDMFGLSMNMQLYTGSGSSYSEAGSVGLTATRSSIFSGFQSYVPSAFASLATYEAPYRIIAPLHGADLGLLSTTYWNSYISSIWSQYTPSNPLVITIQQGTFSGYSSGSEMIFTSPSDPATRICSRTHQREMYGEEWVH